MINAMRRRELVSMFPALSSDHHASSPFVDQLEAAGRPDHFRSNETSVEYSPRAREFKRVSDALDEAKKIAPTMPDVQLLSLSGLDYLHSDFPDRRPLPPKYGEGYDLAAEFVGTSEARGVRTQELRALEAEFDQYLSTAVSGPAPTVVLHSPSAPIYQPRQLDLPEGIEPEAAQAAWPVPYGFTCLRVARLMSSAFGYCCYWCDRFSETSLRPVACTLLVSCELILRTFPTCVSCRFEFDAETGGPNDRLLYFIWNDGWDHATGYPAERHR